MRYKVTIERIETVTKQGKVWHKLYDDNHPLMQISEEKRKECYWEGDAVAKLPKQYGYVATEVTESDTVRVFEQVIDTDRNDFITDVIAAANSMNQQG